MKEFFELSTRLSTLKVLNLFNTIRDNKDNKDIGEGRLNPRRLGVFECQKFLTDT